MAIFDGLGAGAGAAGAALGGPYGAALAGIGGLVGGLFGGGKPKIPRELKRLYDLQLQESRRLQQYSHGIPLSDPQEQAALASQRGLYGEQARQGIANAQAGYNMNLGMQGLPDFLQGLQQQTQGGLQGIQANALQQSLLARQAAGPQAAQLAAGAVGAAQYQTQPDLSAAFGSLARLIGYNQTLRANGGGNQNQLQGQGQNQATWTPQSQSLWDSRNQSPYIQGPLSQYGTQPQQPALTLFGKDQQPLAQAPTPQYGTAPNPQQLLSTSLGK